MLFTGGLLCNHLLLLQTYFGDHRLTIVRAINRVLFGDGEKKEKKKEKGKEKDQRNEQSYFLHSSRGHVNFTFGMAVGGHITEFLQCCH